LPPIRRRLLGWATSAALGGFLIGFHAGVISGALLALRRDFELSDFAQGALVSLLPLGAMAGSLLAGRLADSLGRRDTMLVDGCIFLVGTGLAIVAPSYALLLVSRAVIGLAVGIASSTVPLYLSEIAPVPLRGRIVTTNQLMITVGILVSYAVDLAFVSSGSWRAMFAVGVLPAIALLAGMLWSPETPAWLDSRGHSEGARQVLQRGVGEDEGDRLLEDFRRARDERPERTSVRNLLGSTARPAVLIGVTLAALQQLCGINAIIYYAPSIMERTGLSASNSLLYSVIIGVINVVATVASFRLVDRAGRRPLLLGSLAGMLLALGLLSVTLMVSLGAAGSLLSLLCILAYVAAFAVGVGPVFWILIAEIFPSDARATGTSVSTATNWFSNFVVGLLFLPLAGVIGEAATFWVFGAFCLLAFLFVNRYVPETKGRGFAEIDSDVRARWSREEAKVAA
jgi:SP family galactose:H+ symporter-like MFS transporter